MERPNSLLDAVLRLDACRYAPRSFQCLWCQAVSDGVGEVLDGDSLLGDWLWPGSGRRDHLSPERLTARLAAFRLSFAEMNNSLSKERDNRRGPPVEQTAGRGTGTAMVDHGRDVLEEPLVGTLSEVENVPLGVRANGVAAEITPAL